MITYLMKVNYYLDKSIHPKILLMMNDFFPYVWNLTLYIILYVNDYIIHKYILCTYE